MRWRVEKRCISVAVLVVGQVVFTAYYVVVMAPLKPPPPPPAVLFVAANISAAPTVPRSPPLLSLSRLQLDRRKFFLGQNSSDCFLPGTDTQFSKKMAKCQCHPGWHGKDCGLPEVILR